MVTIQGTGFTGGSVTVSFASSVSHAVSVVSSSQIIAVAPAFAPGATVPILVSVGGIQNMPGPSDQFNYSVEGSAPFVAAISPSSGPSGTSVTILGSGFEPGAVSVYFGSQKSTNVQVTSSSKLIAVAPTGLTPNVDVQVLVGRAISPVNYPADVFDYVGNPVQPTVSVSSPIRPCSGELSWCWAQDSLQIRRSFSVMLNLHQ